MYTVHLQYTVHMCNKQYTVTSNIGYAKCTWPHCIFLMNISNSMVEVEKSAVLKKLCVADFYILVYIKCS